jgi:hypothetical protein
MHETRRAELNAKSVVITSTAATIHYRPPFSYRLSASLNFSTKKRKGEEIS